MVLQQARERALTVLSPSAGPKEATAGFDGSDLLVATRFTYRPPLQGTSVTFGTDTVLLTTITRYR